MKNFNVFLAFFFVFLGFSESKASHYAGLEITYKHISGNTYDVFLFVYRDKGGNANAPISTDICITSSCHPNTVPINMVPYNDTIYNTGPDGIADVPLQNICALPGPDGVVYEVRAFRGRVTLPVVCADWKFQYNGYARNDAIDNIVDPDVQSLYGHAILNNVIGPNSSPYFVTPAAKRFCVSDPNGRDFVWSQATIEPDGDSLYYDFGIPQDGGTTEGCATPSDISFVGNYTRTAPMSTFNGIAIDRKNGTFRFKASRAETVVLRVDIEEWRFNTVTLNYETVGRVTREMQVSIVGDCLPLVQGGPRIDYQSCGAIAAQLPIDSLRKLGAIQVNNTFAGFDGAGDSLVEVPVINSYLCNDATVELCFAPRGLCESITATDFRLLGPDGIARPIVNVQDNCSTDLHSNNVNLNLFQSLDINGPYLLYVKRGNDGNTLVNECGFEMVDHFFMIINVTDCPVLDYSIENVTVVEDEKIKIEFDLVDTSYFSSTFNRINVLRANNDQAFIKVGEVTDQAVREFIDSTVDQYAVDNQIYQYLLQMITNNNPRIPTNFVNSIVLAGNQLSELQMELSWNTYFNDTYGASAEYEVFEGQYDFATNTMAWTSVQVVGNDLSYMYTIPRNPGQYWLKIQANDPSAVNPKTAESNWITVGSPVPPEGQTPMVNYVPNVITPNGDQQNDRFYFQLLPIDPSVRAYSNLSLSIFNRWGKQVFFDNNFMERNTETEGWDGTDQNTGQKLADGVYFYVAQFNDAETGKSEALNGSVTLTASIE